MNNTDHKRAQRERDRAAGKRTVTLTLDADEWEKLELCRTLRNSGAAPYSANEYFALLLINDAAELMQQLKEIKPCTKCGKTLPDTCLGDFKTEAACFLNRSYRQLNLTKLTCQDGEFDLLLTRHYEAQARKYCLSCHERYCGNCVHANGKQENH